MTKLVHHSAGAVPLLDTQAFVAHDRAPRSIKPSGDLFVMGHFLLAAVVVLWLNSGIGAYYLAQLPGTYRWAIAAAWILTSLLSVRQAAPLASSVWPLLLFVAIVIIALPPSDATGQAYLQNIVYMLLAYCLYSFYSAPGYGRYRTLIVGLILLDLAVVGVRTWSALDLNPEISRFLATGATYETILAATAGIWGVGGYPQAYALPAIMLVFLHRAITGTRHRVASWVVVLIGTLLLIRMSFTIAVLMWVAFGLLLLAGETLGRRNQSAVVVGGLVAIPLIILLGPSLLLAVAEGSVPDVIAIRLQEMAGFLTGENASTTDLGARFDQYATSLRALTNNWLSGSTGSGLGTGPVGTHSSWLDSLGAFGLVALLLFAFLLRVFRRQLSTVAPGNRFVLKVAWAYFAVLGIVNTLLFAHLILVWFVLVPFMLQPSDRASLDDASP